MFVSQKRTGEYKGQLAYNGKPTREWISREDKSSPTAYNESIFLTCAIDAKEKRDLMSIDVTNAFIQTHMPLPKDGERVVMKVRGRLVDWLIELDPTSYASKVVFEGKSRVIYLEVLRAIYGMLVASLLWYRKIKTDLESEGFKF